MAVSFKIFKKGRRLYPKSGKQPSASESQENSNASAAEEASGKGKVSDSKIPDVSSILSSIIDEQQISPDYEVSFTLNLLPDGFFIGKSSEAIELGRLPGDVLDDIPSKFYSGAIVCEVRDFRNHSHEQGANDSSLIDVPLVKKVLLRMSLENIVKDIPLITDDSWTYGDLMEIEARALKVIEPKLCLDPKPMLERLSKEPAPNKIKFGICRLKRKELGSDVTVASNSQMHGKKVCIDRVSEVAGLESNDLRNISGHINLPSVNENRNLQHIPSAAQNLRSRSLVVDSSLQSLPSSSQRPSVEQARVHDSLSIGSPGVADISSQNTSPKLANPSIGNLAGSVHGKRETQETQLANVANKRSKMTSLEGNQANQQLSGLQVDSTNGEMWRNTLLRQQLEVKGIQYFPGMTVHRPQMFSDNSDLAGFHPHQQGIKVVKQEQFESGIKMDRPNIDKIKNVLQVVEPDNNQAHPQQLRHHQLAQQTLLRTQFTPQQLNNPGATSEKDRRKAAQSPRISPGALVQSAIPSKSGDFSTAPLFGPQKEKATVVSTSAVSSPSDSLQRIPQGPSGKGKKGSISKAAHTMSGVASPASVSNNSAPLSANSPSVAATSMASVDPAILERFLKIEAITQSYRLNNKKTQTENAIVKNAVTHPTKHISFLLSNSGNGEDFTDPTRMMSRSIFNGSINTCKMRVVKSSRSHSFQGTSIMLPSRSDNKLFMSERPSDGSVAMLYSDSTDDTDAVSHECSFILPTTLYADLLADQYVCLLKREGYQVVEDQVHPIGKRFVMACGNHFLTMAMLSEGFTPEGQQLEGISGQQLNVHSNSTMNPQSSSQGVPNSARATPGNNQGLPMTQGYLQGGQNSTVPARAQQIEQNLLQQQQTQQQQQIQMQQQHQQQQQIQHPSSQIQQQPQAQLQLQRSSSVLQMNQMNHLSQFIGQNSNMQLGGNQMVNKASHMQFQLHQAQQQQQLSKKPMMGIGAAAMGLGNNMMALGGLGNVVGMRGLSSPMSPMSGLPNIGPNQMNLGSTANFNVGFRPGAIPNHIIAAKMKMAQAQNRANLFNPQTSLTGMPGSTGQMLSNTVGMPVLNQTLSRPTVNPIQRTVISAMGPPKIPGPNLYMPPQMHMQQLQHQQQLQQMQQQQEQQQQQQISSPLQQQPQVSSPMVGSPAMSMQQQMPTQPMSQQTVSPQQLNAGALQQMNNSIVGPGPGSPQLSSQTHGSIGSISSSPMEQLQQGTNKGSSMNAG